MCVCSSQHWMQREEQFSQSTSVERRTEGGWWWWTFTAPEWTVTTLAGWTTNWGSTQPFRRDAPLLRELESRCVVQLLREMCAVNPLLLQAGGSRWWLQLLPRGHWQCIHHRGSGKSLFDHCGHHCISSSSTSLRASYTGVPQERSFSSLSSRIPLWLMALFN